jgi:hypothetical protein
VTAATLIALKISHDSNSRISTFNLSNDSTNEIITKLNESQNGSTQMLIKKLDDLEKTTLKTIITNLEAIKNKKPLLEKKQQKLPAKDSKRNTEAK